MSDAVIPDDAVLEQLCQRLGERLVARGEKIGTAESCTGGLIAKVMTDIAGSSRWFERGVVTYSNEAKGELLGVPGAKEDGFVAVSSRTVLAMADGMKASAPVQWSVAVSGVAGPTGGSPTKPVGTVYIAWAGPGIATSSSRFQFGGDRDAVRRRTAEAALRGLHDLLDALDAA